MSVDMRRDYSPAIISIYDRKTEQMYQEISLLALDKESGNIKAIGNEAKQLIDYKDDNIIVLSPLRNGAIADYPLAEKMLHYMLRKALGVRKFYFNKPTIAAFVPADYTIVERKALEDALYMSGARKILITEKTKSAADLTDLSSYRVHIEIILNEARERERKEGWREICKGEIPADTYQITSVSSQESKTIITMTGHKNVAEVIFERVFVLKTMAKVAIPDDYFAENELEKYRKNSFGNVIYQIEEGQLSNNLSSRGRAYYLDSKHYILVVEAEIVEVIAEYRDIVVRTII